MSVPTLTKRNQVLAEVAAGATIEKCSDAPGMLRLVKAGREIRAWQTALQSASRVLGVPNAPR